MTTSTLKIQTALQSVLALRQLQAKDAELTQALRKVKLFQARRFKATYADLLRDPRYQSAARFFLEELYGDRDYAGRDQQFARIASTVGRLFPENVVNTAVALAEVHALTEALDDLMARAWMARQPADSDATETACYVACWRQLANPAARALQLEAVLQLGHAIDRLTRTPGLRTLLRMMRGPASAANLQALQQFLESGFDAFAAMRGAEYFLDSVSGRETDWMELLFNAELEVCEIRLNTLLAESWAH